MVHYFSLYLEDYGRRERFEWKSSGGAEVRALGHSTGMKLVRVKTGEVVAAYADVSCAWTKKGKICFLGTDLGDEWRVMVVMSLVALLEARRRSRSSNAGSSSAVFAACS